MKTDLLKPSQQQPVAPNIPSYFVWEQHNVTLIKSTNYGYGIAISGGLCNNTNQDPSIYVSDIVPGGPAQHKLYINDKLLSVNGVSVENVEHSFVIRLLKEAKEFIHLVIKRKINDIYNTKEALLKQQEANSIDQSNSTSTIKRCNQAIMQTANTILANFNQNEINSTDNNVGEHTTIPLLKPIKVTLNRKDKKDGFGIVLGCKYFIKEILPETVAANETNLRKGDILLKLNDLSSDQLSLSEARKMLVKSNKLNLSVKRNSLASSSDSEEFSDDINVHKPDLLDMVDSSVSNQIISVPPPVPETRPKNLPLVNQNNNMLRNDYQSHDEMMKTSENSSSQQHQLPIKQLFKPIKENCNNSRMPKFYANKNPVLNYRTIRFARENGIGIRLAGGNKVGIFICDVQYNSPAERAGLKIADKIIKVNNTDYSSLTREEAVHHILMIQNTIEMIVALSQEEYEQYAFDPLGGDSFYIRAHFNYKSQSNVDLSFQINDILHVTDTLYNGVMGQWVATKLNDLSKDAIASGKPQQPQSIEQQSRGTIPNQTNAEQLVTTAQTIDQICTSETAANVNHLNLHSIGASARMSIRKKLGKTALAKRSKSASRSNANSDSEDSKPVQVKKPDAKVSKANTFCGSKYPAYEKVVLKEVNFIRPVVIFGSLADVARDRLKQEMPNKFAIPESYSTEADAQSSGVIKLASIKAIIDKSQHCLLDITPNAVEHLNYAQYFPICVFLNADSQGHVKELRHKYAKTMKLKSSKRLFENANRLNTFYSHLFTDTINLESSQWSKKLKEVIECQQAQPLWIAQELDELLNTQKPSPVNDQQQVSPLNYDMTMQQQKFIAKQNQLMKMQYHQQQLSEARTMFDDNFELPIYTSNQANSQFPGISGAASTYSLYEDQNYRSSFAASDSDVCVASNNQNNTSNHQPIYSTNFNSSRANSTQNYMHQEALINDHSTPQAQPQEDQNLTRFKSDSNLISYDLATQQANNGKYATFNPKDHVSKNAFIQKTNNYEQHTQSNYRRLSTNSDYMQMANNNNSNQQQDSQVAPALPPQNPRANYKLIKNSQSTLMPSMQSAIIDNSMHYADLNEQTSCSSLNVSRSLLQPISGNADSLVDKLKMLKMSSSDLKHDVVPHNNNMNYYNQQQQQQTSKSETESMPLKRPVSNTPTKKEPPTKPPPPTLPKPKFNLPQSSVTNLVLQRNLKAKSELNIATPIGYLSSSASSGASSTSSSKDIINTTSPDELTKTREQRNISTKQPIEVQHIIQPGNTKLAKNKFLENNSLISSSQGYHSDTWESHSSRQSFEIMDQKETKHLPPSRYKTFNKAGKLMPEPKLAKNTTVVNVPSNSILKNTDTTGSTSDGSLNGISGDDTDSIPHGYNNNNMIEKKKANSSSASSSASCSSTSSAAAISGATTLSSNSNNSFSAAVQAVMKANQVPEKQQQGQRSAIELPIYYQTSNNMPATPEDVTKAIEDKNHSQSMNNSNNSNNSYTDLYTNEALKYSRPSGSTYIAHYNDNGVYRKLSLDSNSNCSIIASANGIFDSNGGILESADTGVSINVPEGAIASGYSFDLYFKVCHCKSNITNGKGDLLTNPIVMCGPRGVKFLKPIELQIPHFISIDGQSWSYAFKTCDLDDSFNFSRFQKKTLLNSVIVSIDSF